MELTLRCRKCNKIFSASLYKKQLQELIVSEGFSFLCHICLQDEPINDTNPFKAGYLTEIWIKEE